MSISINREDEFTWQINDNTDAMRVPAYVYSSAELMEKTRTDRSLEQLANVATLPGIVDKVVAMPDIHQGYGFPIGGVAAFDFEEGIVSPGGVGYDINCGVSLIRSNLRRDELKSQINEIVTELFNSIPTGTGKKGFRVNSSQLDEILFGGLKWALENGHANEKDLEHTELRGSLKVDNLRSISHRARERGMPQLKTLGAGNHFLEVQVVDRIYKPDVAKSYGIDFENQVMVMVHTGSRGFGHQVATDFLNRLDSSEEGSVKSQRDRQLVSAHAKSRIAEDYLESMNAAANFAYVNRQLIAGSLMDVFSSTLHRTREDMDMQIVYSLAHNIARVEDHDIEGRRTKVIVHRKGATRAFPAELSDSPFSKFGHPVLVPGDMGSASYVLVGRKENISRSFGSSCHGAGRNLSRHASIASFKPSYVKKMLSDRNVAFRAASDKVLSEEAPGSYKDVDEVVRSAEGANLTDIVARLVPIGVIKG